MVKFFLDLPTERIELFHTEVDTSITAQIQGEEQELGSRQPDFEMTVIRSERDVTWRLSVAFSRESGLGTRGVLVDSPCREFGWNAQVTGWT